MIQPSQQYILKTINHQAVKSNSISGDNLAGIVLALHLIDPSINITVKQDTVEAVNINDLENYIAYSNIHYTQKYKYKTNKYSWWIKDIKSFEYYTLYTFHTLKFIEGFIGLFKTYNKDFRNYISGPPMKDGIELSIAGYDIPPSSYPIRKQAPITGIFLNGFESDFRGEDYE